MKRIVRSLSALFIAGMLLGLSLLSLRTVMAIDREAPAPLSAASALYRTLDDFDTGDSRTCYANNDGWIASPCPITGGGPRYAVMSYDVTMSTAAYAYLPIEITPTGSTDLSGWNWVWAVVQGQSGGEKINAEFARVSSDEFPKIKIDDYMQGGITTTWRAAAIPFGAFNLSARSGIDRFSLLARNAISSGVGEIHVDEVRLLPAVVIIDDYHDPGLKNELGGDSNVWPSDGPRFITPTFPGGMLNLQYSVSPAASSAYWTSLRSTNLLSYMKGLFFEVHGEQGRERVAVEFADCGLNGYSHYPKIMIGDYLEDGITTISRTAAIPLAAFVGVGADLDPGVDWNCIDSLNFYVSGEEPYSSGQGTIYVDNLRLVPEGILPIVVDRFQGCNQWNALGGEWYSGTNAIFTPTLDSAANHSGSYGCGYRLAHDVGLGESAWVWTELSGLDVSDYDYLEFYIKGIVGNEYVNVKLENRGSQPNIYGIGTSVGTGWQLKKLPLREFQAHNVDLTDLKALSFVFEDGIRFGEVDVDDIRFTKFYSTSLPVILSAPQTDLWLRNHTGGAVSYTIAGIGTKTVTPTEASPFHWGRFPAGIYWVTWKRISPPDCENSGNGLFPAGYFEPPPMVCGH
jgi:hypothetical protein